MKATLRILLPMVMAAVLPPLVLANTLTLSNGGNVTGDAGAVVGWGFTFSAGASTDWYILTFSEFLPATPIGTFGDYIELPQNFYEVAPFTQALAPFDPATQSGVGEFDLSPAAPGGTVFGTIRLHYDSYFSFPDSGGMIDALDNTLDVPVTITVNGPATESPEPGFLLLTGICFAGGLLARRGSLRGGSPQSLESAEQRPTT